MALKQCKECKKEISANAKSCPHCGVKHPGMTTGDMVKGLAFFLVLGIAGALFMGGNDETTGNELSDQQCKESLQCWGERHSINARVYCPSSIEKLAKFDAEWTDKTLEPKFSHYRWQDQEKGIVTYIGDKVKFQNGFGAWQNYRYECDFDPERDAVVGVRAQVGRVQ